MKKTLLLILSVCFLFAAVGCSSGTDYSSDIDRLNAQIEQLQSELNALKGENSDTDALKEQIEQLQEQITALQQENAALEESSSQNADKITDLQNETTALKEELAAATARLTALEAVVNTEPVVCDFGDTYTLSNNGIDLFSIKFISYNGYDEETQTFHALRCDITNYNMPACPNSNFISAYAISSEEEFPHTLKSTTVINRDETFNIGFLFSDSSSPMGYADPNKLTAVYIGIPTGSSSDNTIIPFVVLDMNGTNS